MADRVGNWLEDLGLGRYAEAFAENAIEWTHLPDLDQESLQAIGVTAVGHRLTILKAVAALSGQRSDASPDDSPAVKSADVLAAWERHPGERKPVTMLFADITGSTELTEKLDAEEAHDLLYGAIQRMCAAVENNRGTVCRFMGDGVMAMFGAPVASEHHAVDACGAALEMQEGLRDYAAGIEARHGSGLKIRVGLHSGEVVVLTVGEGEKVEYDASGPTVPIAARMEQAAQPGEVFITAATQVLAAGRIETEALHPVSVKGITEPVPVFALRRVRSPEEAATAVTRTPFVGRRVELGQFRVMLDTCVEEGHGQTVYVRGEPGIGKTRLLEEFARIAAEKGISAHRGLVLPFGVGKGQDAIRSLVRSLLGIPPESGKAVRQQVAATAISNGWLDADQAVFLNDLLDLPQPTEQRALYDAMDNATRNEGKHSAASKLLGVTSNTQPILAVIEDVHWADAITLAHLSSLAKTVAECPALLVMTSRIEGDQIDRPWLSGTDGCPFVTIELGPLRKMESLALIGKFVDANDALADSYLERAAGNPLFLEELLRNANEDTTKSLPDSIQSLVLARLDRLAPEDKRALQAASVLGQRFETGLLRHLIENEDYDCRGLVEHNLARPDAAAYLFAHALIQEGVYGSLLKRRRRHLHEKAAEWFAGDDLVLHAQHLDQADDERAPAAYLAAAREQAQQYRIERALSLVESGLHLASRHSDRHRLNCLKGELLHDLGNIEASMGVYRESLESAEDDEQRCDAWMGLAAGLRVSTDYESALEMLDKVEPIARQRNFTPQLARLHHLRGNLYFQLGNDECHREHATALGLAQRAGLVEEEARALGGLGDAAYAAGLMVTAHDNFRRCIELCNEHGFGRIEAAYLGMITFSQMYFCSLEDAKLSALTAIDAALRVGHQRAEMNSRLGMCDILLLTGEHDLVEEHTERGLALARALGARAWEAPMLLYRGLALHGTCPSDAIELVTRAASMSRDIGKAFNGGRAFGCLAWVADSRALRESALEEGESVLNEGAISHNYVWFYRLAMETLLAVNEWDRVEYYADALEDFTKAEPLQLTDLLIARGRALATFGRGKRDDTTIQELRRLRDEAKSVGFNVAIPALEKALSRATR